MTNIVFFVIDINTVNVIVIVNVIFIIVMLLLLLLLLLLTKLLVQQKPLDSSKLETAVSGAF